MSGALAGEGNDMASLNFLNANLEDNDELHSASITNDGGFWQNGSATAATPMPRKASRPARAAANPARAA
jgi:hypothetical protein